MTFRERLNALFFGRVWLSVMCGSTQPPVWISTDKTVFVNSIQKNTKRFLEILLLTLLLLLGVAIIAVGFAFI